MVASAHAVLMMKMLRVMLTSAKFITIILALKQRKLFTSHGKYAIYNWLASSGVS